jgi:hypothetical protein
MPAAPVFLFDAGCVTRTRRFRLLAGDCGRADFCAAADRHV